MNGRERLNAVFHRQPTEGLAWTTLVDNNALSILPPDLQGMSGIEFYRHIGCDILLLDGWGTGYNLTAPRLVWPEGVEEVTQAEGEWSTWELRTPFGVLTSRRRRGHPLNYPVTTLEDVRVYRSLWEAARYEPHDDTEALAGIHATIREDGIVTRYWGPSTASRLLQVEMGTEAFYYLLNDHPEEMEGLMDAMHQKQLQAFEIMAQGPVDVLILCENTSTFYISPEAYRLYNGPHVRDFVDIAHQHGKVAVVHMCGHIHKILQLIKDTGLDGVHGLTPPTVGDCPWEDYLDVLGEDQVVIGVLDPITFVQGPIDQIGPWLDAAYTPRIRRSNFCLWAAADGLPVPVERFRAVGDWMRRNGGR
ncbi:MAG: uroporphyrinogen decarboxylase family protein [Anaerolineae bacterium]